MRPRLLALAAAFALGPCAAFAAWTAPAPLGASTKATSAPSCATVADAEVVCAVRNTAHKMAVIRYRNGAWSGWTVLAGVITSAPSCTERGTREVVCVARNATNKLLYTIFNGTSWRAPSSTAGGAIFSAPSCARMSASQILCAARGAAGGLTAATLTGTTWSSFTVVAVPGGAIAPPSCASDGNGGVACMTLDNFSRLVANRFAGGAWQGFTYFGETSIADPTCSEFEVGAVACFVRTTATAGRAIRWHIGSFSGHDALGGILRTPAHCALAPSYLFCLTIGTDSNAFVNSWNRQSPHWSGWSAVAASAVINDIACTAFSTSKADVLCVFTGANNQLYSRFGPFR